MAHDPHLSYLLMKLNDKGGRSKTFTYELYCTYQHCKIWLQMFVEMVCMHPGSCHIYLKVRDMKKAENDATARMACFQIHHLKQSAREQ